MKSFALYSCLAVALPTALACDLAMVLQDEVVPCSQCPSHATRCPECYCGPASFGMGSIELLATVYELQIPSSIAPLLAESNLTFLQV